MARKHFTLPNVAANARVRIDTASGSSSAADVINDSGQAVAGAILHADASGFLGDEIYGPADGTKTLYLKTLNDSDAVTATVTLTAQHSAVVTAATLEPRVAALEDAPSGASVALSGKRLASVSLGTGQTITHGGDQPIDFTDATIVKGADYWGVPGSALDLDVTSDDRGVIYPDDAADRQFAVTGYLSLTASDVADVGKQVKISVSGNNGNWATFWTIPEGLTSNVFGFSLTDQVFLGDTGDVLRLRIGAMDLAHDIDVTQATVIFIEQ